MTDMTEDRLLAALLRRKMTCILGKKLILEDISTAQFIERVPHEEVGPNSRVYMGDFKGKYFTYRINHGIGSYPISRTVLMRYAFHKDVTPNSHCSMYVKIMDDDMHGYIVIDNQMGTELPDAMYKRVKEKLDSLVLAGTVSPKNLQSYEQLYIPSFVGEFLDYPCQVLSRMTDNYEVTFSSQKIIKGLRTTVRDYTRDIENIFKIKDEADEFLSTHFSDILEVIRNEESWLFNLQLLGFSTDNIQKIIFHLGLNRGLYESDSTYGLFHEQYFKVGRKYLIEHGIV